MRIPLTTPVDDGDTVRSGVTVDHIVIYPDKSIVINAKSGPTKEIPITSIPPVALAALDDFLNKLKNVAKDRY